MAKRKRASPEKSKSFTTINLLLPVKVSICGTNEVQNKWKSFFKRKNAPSKNEFIMKNFFKDMGVKNVYELFDNRKPKRLDNEKLSWLIEDELQFPSMPAYFAFIIDRALEEKSGEVKDAKS